MSRGAGTVNVLGQYVLSGPIVAVHLFSTRAPMNKCTATYRTLRAYWVVDLLCTKGSLFQGPEFSEKSTINLVAKCKGKDVLASHMWTASILL